MSADLSFMWLEITGKCQLQCSHCYAESGPLGTHGLMTDADWCRVINESGELGVAMVQFIGGEPTLHPSFPPLVRHALDSGLQVEVFSNLIYVPERIWGVLGLPGVRLATSYYADNRAAHEAITGRRGSHTRTKGNIIEALRRSIPLRVGIIDVHDGQRTRQAHAELEALGVNDIATDRLRQVGRGVRDKTPDINQLCGNCASGVLAVSPEGDVWPCVFSRWLPAGNVRDRSLAEIINGGRFREVRDGLAQHFQRRPHNARCEPTWCEPYKADCHPKCGPATRCDPTSCRPSCLPPRR